MLSKDRFHCDNLFFYSYSLKKRLKLFFIQDHWILIRKYLFLLRRCEYFASGKSIVSKLCMYWYECRKNKLGNKLGFYISPNTLGSNVTIWHHGSLIINGDAKIGKNCIFHGNNCIGNNGKDIEAPRLHDKVELGFGASVIGNVEIAEGVKIGAGAVVTKSCLTRNATLVGIPAKEIRRKF